MPTDGNQFMNALFREQRSSPSFGVDADPGAVNRAIRRAAGHDVPEPAPSHPTVRSPSSTTADPRTAARHLLAVAAKPVIDSEPVAGIDPPKRYDEWLWRREVVDLLDANGYLPSERGYDPSTAAAIVGADWPGEQAMAARKARWQQLARHFQ